MAAPHSFLESLHNWIGSRPRLSAVLVGITFCGGLLLTGLGVVQSHNFYKHEAKSSFTRMADRLGAEVQRRMNQSLYGLKGARGLYAARGTLTRGEFRSYVESRDIPQEFPGVLGFGFIQRVMRPDVPAFLAAEKADGAPDFEIRTAGDAPDLYVIKFIDPLERNRPAWGYDVASEAVRREAVERAVRTGEPSITARITLLQDDHSRAGFLFLVPVFGGAGVPKTPEERTQRLVGLVYAPVVIDDVFRGLMQGADDMLDVEVFDGAPLRANLLLDADEQLVAARDASSRLPYDGRTFRETIRVRVGGREWTLVMTSRPVFEENVSNHVPLFIGVSGAGLTVLLSGIVLALGMSRARALTLAEEMTRTLRQSEATARRLAMVASRTSNAVVITDSRGEIEWVNDGFTRITGYALEEVKGRTPGSVLQGPLTDPATVEVMRAGIAAGTGFVVEVINYAKSGSWYWLAVEVQPLRDEAGNVVGFMAIESDITARKEAERKLALAIQEAREAAAKAEQANVAKSQFLATMSHEIRTPMNGVIGMTSLLLDTPLNAQQREFTEIVRSSGETLLSLINDILDFSKIESGRMELESEPFSIHECLESALDLFAARAAEKRIELYYEVAPNVPEDVRGDVTRLRQVLVNLVGNALKFTERGEIEITVTARAAQPNRTELQFTVRDTGIGIPAAAQAKLFRSFSQVDASTTRKYGGTGLGLAISKRLAEMMGGRMWVDSTAGVGSKFMFSVTIEPVAGLGVRRAGTAAIAGQKVLIVEPHPVGRRILTTLSEKWGMEARVCVDGAEALALLRGGARFTLAILDRHMSDMDGLALAREVRKTSGGETLPLVLLSSIGLRIEPDDRRLFAAVLSKPIKATQLAQALAAACNGPADVVETASWTRPEPTQNAVSALHVLLAEDNPVNQKVALHMLRRAGYRADVAGNGIEAIAAVHRQPYDVVLMDMQMPEMDGLEATRRIRAQEEQGVLRTRVRIVALTANAMDSDRDECLRAGMDDYLSKPMKEAELRAVLDRAAVRIVQNGAETTD